MHVECSRVKKKKKNVPSEIINSEESPEIILMLKIKLEN